MQEYEILNTIKKFKLNNININNWIKNDKNKILYCIDKLDALNIVTIKLNDPNNELNPNMCNEKNIKSIEQ